MQELINSVDDAESQTSALCENIIHGYVGRSGGKAGAADRKRNNSSVRMFAASLPEAQRLSAQTKLADVMT